MSLKAKLEAVIYAADEPVTLAQLAALFAEEAMEGKAEQESRAQAQPAEPAAPSAAEAAALPLLNEALAFFELEQDTAAEPSPVADEAGVEPDAKTAPARDRETSQANAEVDALNAAVGAQSAEADGTVAGAEGESTATDDAAAAAGRRVARLREREVREVIKKLLDELIAEYAGDGRGIEIREIAGGYRMATKPECHDTVRSFVKNLKPPLKLSLPALETLAVIAYKQPVTAPEVNEIRGVDSSAVFGTLLARKLITTAGRKPVIGRPILYKTTREFLLHFGLKDVSELPSMEEFEKLAASELAEPEFVTGEAAAPEAADFSPDMSLEADEAASEERERAPDAKRETETTARPAPGPLQAAPHGAE